MRRVVSALLLAAALAPSAFLRDAQPVPDRRPILHAIPLAHPGRTAPGSAVDIAGAWELTSPNDDFGSYSALVARGDGRLAGFSDRGTWLEFSPPGAAARGPPRFGLLAPRRATVAKRERDCEAVTLDPASGTLWAAYERTNAIVRFAPGLAPSGRAVPAAMRDWPSNSGPEAMVRLADGRFVVLAETRIDARLHRALLFPGDPVGGARPLAFAYAPPPGFRPTDIAQLPDGRVLVLNRKLRFPWRFTVALTLADPRAIRAGKVWRGREIARLAAPVPDDNFEGMAIVPAANGEVAIWLISDDNQAQHVQRTLLLKLLWKPGREN